MQMASMAGMVLGVSEERKMVKVERSWERVGGMLSAGE